MHTLHTCNIEVSFEESRATLVSVGCANIHIPYALYAYKCTVRENAYITQYVHTNIHTQRAQSVRPYDSSKIFKGRPHRNAFSKLVHRQYKSFPPDRFCQVEIQNTSGLSNKPSTG